MRGSGAHIEGKEGVEGEGRGGEGREGGRKGLVRGL